MMVQDSKRREFEIQVLYFKGTGKYYAEATFVGTFADSGIEVPTCAMYEVVDHVRRLRGTGRLPGLQSGTWDGYVLVNCPDGFPRLIPPGPCCERDVKTVMPLALFGTSGNIESRSSRMCVSYDPIDREITLDGDFTAEQLEGLAWWMRTHKE